MKANVFLLVAAAFLVLASPVISKPTMLGGVSSSTPVDDKARQAASLAVTKLNSDQTVRSNMLGASVQPLTLVAIKDVRTQVVAGTNYFLTLTVKDSSGQQFDMEATVWSRPWLEGRNSEDGEAWQLTKAQRIDA